MSRKCVAIVQSGERKGQICNKNTKDPNGHYCGRHTNESLLCEYLPNGYCLNGDSPFESYEFGRDTTSTLDGYINIRVGFPVFEGDESIPLVLMSSIEPGDLHFTKKTLAIELSKSIGYVLSRSDIYNVTLNGMSRMHLQSISYDNEYAIYRANIILR